MRPTRWRRCTHILIGAAMLGAAVLTGCASTGDAKTSAATPALVTAQPAVMPVADGAPTPTPGGLADALRLPLANPDLGALTGRVADALTGKQLWEQASLLPMQPASTVKSLTAAAALLALEHDARLTTKVMADESRPDRVVLVGGGDATLSSAPAGKEPLYRDAARICDLADQVRSSGVTPTSIQVDISAFSGSPMAPGWDPADIQGGDIAPIESVMVDGGRTQPLTDESVRSITPALDAGRSLAAALSIDPRSVTVITTPVRDGREIAAVQSPPLLDRLRKMMNDSDNVMAETIAREVAVAMGLPASFAGAVEAITRSLDAAGVDMTGVVLFDASGLSVDDRLTSKTLDDVIGAAAGSDLPDLRPLLDVLAIAGGSGTLSNRYLDPQTDDAAGWLRAKTGSLTGTNALAGIVTDLSGRVLTFALISNNAGPTGRNALDDLAATLRYCGCDS